MANFLSPPPRFQAIDDNGDPIAGGLLYTYAAGTSTPIATYTTQAGTIANQNPIVLDTSGRAAIYLVQGTGYKFVLKDSLGSTIYTQDNILIPEAARTDWVESVTGLNTDNTDPQNPIIQISVDGTTIDGAGTVADPLAWIAPPPTTLITSTPTTQTGATYTVAATDFQVIANRAGTITLTLPSAATFDGRMLLIRTITANTVVSASANVIPATGAAASTAILPATDGAWALLQSNGTNWLISENSSTGGGGGMAIGDPVTSGTTDCVLFVASGPVLAQDTAFKWDAATNKLILSTSLEVSLTPELDILMGIGCLTNSGASVGNNIAIGNQVFEGALAGEENIGIGHVALNVVTTGSYLVGLGRFAGGTLTTGSNGTFVGVEADGTATDDNQNSFGYQATCTATNQVTLGNASIATLRCQQTSITALSDRRDKTKIKDLPLGLDFINSVRPVSFYWADRNTGAAKNTQMEAGFIAQELQSASEKHRAEWLRLVDATNPDRLEATPGRLLPVIVRAIQELSAKVDALAK